METPQSSSITDINSSQSSKENHRAVPFITFDNQTKKFVISSEARAIISKPEYKKVGIVHNPDTVDYKLKKLALDKNYDKIYR